MEEATRRFLARREDAKRQLARALEKPRTAQEGFLGRLVTENAGAEFGREHGFGQMRGVEDFRRGVPLRRYEDYAARIERLAAGERGILTVEGPLLFRLTSGTTGTPKKVPVTRASLVHEIPYLHLLLGVGAERYPEAVESNDAILNLLINPKSALTLTTPSGLLHRPYSDSLAPTGPESPLYGAPGSLASWYAPLDGRTSVADLSYHRLRLAIERDVLGVMCITPSTVVALSQQLAAAAPRLAEELRRGTVLGEPCAAPNPVRARELEELAARHGVRMLGHVWPRLRFVTCWKSGSCALYLPQLQECCGPQVEVLDFGYLSSEAPFTVPVDAHPTAGLLAVHCAFFEFLPVEAEDPAADAPTLLFDEVETGREYQVVVSGANGLYRYLIGDIVRVVEMVRGVPRMEFIGRGSAVNSFTAEKLTESQIIDAAEAAWRSLGLRVGSFTCCPVFGSTPWYAFVVEAAEPRAIDCERLGAEIDRQLGARNLLYRAEREAKRLGAVTAHPVSPGTFSRYRGWLIEHRMASAVQLKDKQLQKDDAPLSVLLRLSAA